MDKIQKVALRAFKFENQDAKKFTSEVFDNVKVVLKENFTVSSRRMYLNHGDPLKENDSLSYYDFMNNDNHIIGTLLRSSEEDTQPQIDNSLFQKPKFAMADLNKTGVKTGIVYKEHFYIALSKNYLVTNLKPQISGKRIQTYINYLTNTSCCSLTPVLEKHTEIGFDKIRTISLNDCPLTLSHDEISNKDFNKKEFKKSLFLKPSEIIKFIKERINYNNEVKMLSDDDLIEMVSAQLILGFHKPKNADQEEHMKRMAELTLKYVDDPSDVVIRGDKNKNLNGKKLLKIKNVEIEKTDHNDIIEQELYQEMAVFLTELEDEESI